MSFEVRSIQGNERWVEATETLWLTADRDRLVPDGDPDAAFLYVTPGKRISVEDAERFEMTTVAVAAPAAAADGDDEDGGEVEDDAAARRKARRAARNKQRRASANKEAAAAETDEDAE